jgi:hypothetical protein
MTIRRALAVVLLSCVSVWAQTGEMGSMRDPRLTNNSQVSGAGSGAGAIQPWLAVNGAYDTYLDQPASYQGSIRRTVSLSGGLSVAKAFHRTFMILGYSGSGTDYIGRAAGINEGWKSSNVVTLALSSQVSRRLTLDFSESGGAANGGFGSAAAGLQSGGLGLLGSMGVGSGFLFGGGVGLGGVPTGLNPLQNGLVDADFYQQMTYFSSTSAGAGFLLSSRTMLNIGGTASFIRRAGRNFSDSNIVGANATLSTQLSRRFSTFFGYSFNEIDFIRSIGKTYIQGGFTGLKFALSRNDELSLSVSDSYVDTKFALTVALPPDIAALLGVAHMTTVKSTSRSYAGGKLLYTHSFQRGGFNLSCNSMVAPGNDLILLARSEGCSLSLSRSLTQRFSITGLGGLRRLSGMSQSGSRYDVANGGVVFSYRIFKGLALTAGANYRATEVRPSFQTTTDVTGNAGLYWSPREGVHLF